MTETEALPSVAFDFQDSGSGERGCGRRVKGGLYAVTDVADYGGTPWTDCLIDPPEPMTDRMMTELGIAPRDVSLRSFVDPQGLTQFYLLDWIGKDGYPNVADLLNEALSGKGFSGRVPENKYDWSKLDLQPGSPTQSERYLISPNAIITNPEEFWHYRIWDRYRGSCLTGQALHNVRDDPPDFCDSLWWECVEGGLPINDDPDDRRVIRQIGSLSYPAYRPPTGVTPVYQAGIFMKLKFRLEIIIDPLTRHHEDVAAMLDAAGQTYRFAED